MSRKYKIINYKKIAREIQKSLGFKRKPKSKPKPRRRPKRSSSSKGKRR